MNEAHARTDALLHCSVEGEATTPPASPADGENWIVATGAGDDWTGLDGAIACRQSGNWLYVAPRDGMRVFDRSTGQEFLFNGGWLAPSAPAEPIGGSTVDVEARSAIEALIAALRSAGVFPAS